MNAEYIYRMEDVLDLYEEPYNEKMSVVCFDEKLVQLIEDIYQPMQPSSGRSKKVDYEYERKGACNLFNLSCDLLRNKKKSSQRL